MATSTTSIVTDTKFSMITLTKESKNICKVLDPALSYKRSCNKDFQNKKQALLEQILESIQDDQVKVNSKKGVEEPNETVKCRYEKHGCVQVLNKSKRKVHEEDCNFRKAYCFYLKCKPHNIKISPLKFEDHFNNCHPEIGSLQKIFVKSTSFTLENDVKTTTLIFVQDKLSYIFVKRYGVKGYSTVIKACLVSLSPPEEARSFKCSLAMISNAKEVLNHNGKVFSIEETKDLWEIDSGGLIYPSEILGKVKFRMSIKNT